MDWWGVETISWALYDFDSKPMDQAQTERPGPWDVWYLNLISSRNHIYLCVFSEFSLVAISSQYYQTVTVSGELDQPRRMIWIFDEDWLKIIKNTDQTWMNWNLDLESKSSFREAWSRVEIIIQALVSSRNRGLEWCDFESKPLCKLNRFRVEIMISTRNHLVISTRNDEISTRNLIWSKFDQRGFRVKISLIWSV